MKDEKRLSSWPTSCWASFELGSRFKEGQVLCVLLSESLLASPHICAY
jgi:hypothetical protein